MSLQPVTPAPQPVNSQPRADLLPPEVEEGRQARRVRANSIVAVVLVLALVVAGYVGLSLLAINAQAELAAAQQRTQDLLTEQAKYAEAQHVTSLIAAATAGREVGTSTEIDWKVYLQRIQDLLPAGTIITNFRAQTASPMSDFQQPNAPLQGDRIGELSFTAETPGLPEVESWLISLRELPGFVDAAPGTVALETTGIYQASITMHIDVGAYLNRYDPENPGTPGLLPDAGTEVNEADETGTDEEQSADESEEG